MRYLERNRAQFMYTVPCTLSINRLEAMNWNRIRARACFVLRSERNEATTYTLTEAIKILHYSVRTTRAEPTNKGARDREGTERNGTATRIHLYACIAACSVRPFMFGLRSKQAIHEANKSWHGIDTFSHGRAPFVA